MLQKIAASCAIAMPSVADANNSNKSLPMAWKHTLSTMRSKKSSFVMMLLLLLLINYAAMIFVLTLTTASSAEHLSHLPPPKSLLTSSSANEQHLGDNSSKRHNEQATAVARPHILLAGMAFSDNAISDSALNFLIQAACSHGIPTHILLAKRDDGTPLDKKIEALCAHTQPLQRITSSGGGHTPACRHLITVAVSPGEEYLLNMTKSHHAQLNDSQSLEEDTPNNPWNQSNRIARIKRSREYQRQLVIQMLNNNHNNFNGNKNHGVNVVDWSTVFPNNAVVAVLDLDLFSYPSPLEIIQSARDYIMLNNHDVVGEKNKYHAICSNGLFVQKSRKYNGSYRRRYYDTFSTILLPNSWLHVDREEPRGSLLGEDVDMARMTQDETLQWILKEGRRSKRRSGMINNDNGKNKREEEEEVTQAQHHQYYQPVPVRSCFNGLTLYRADVWLQPQCRYDSYHKDDDAYLSKRYHHACEHIVFHECLRRVMMMMMTKMDDEGGSGGSNSSGVGFNIAVQPDLTTLWHHLS